MGTKGALGVLAGVVVGYAVISIAVGTIWEAMADHSAGLSVRMAGKKTVGVLVALGIGLGGG